MLRGEPDAGQRLPRVRRRGHRLARARARLLAQGRGRDGGPDRLGAGPAVAQDGPRVPRARRSTCRWPVRSRPTARSRPTPSATARTPTRYGPPAAARRRRASATRTRPAITTRPAGDATAATVAQPTKVDNDLYVRDYSKCILCYKCVDACGEEAQNTFAIAVAGRGFDARISTEQAVPLPESACVYCGNCIGVCPTGALMFKSEYDMREAGTWDESAQTVTDDDLPVLRRRLRRRRSTPRTTASSRSPRRLDSSVTDGHLCIKGRFGFEFVNNRPGRSGALWRSPHARRPSRKKASVEPLPLSSIAPRGSSSNASPSAVATASETWIRPGGAVVSRRLATLTASPHRS